MAGPWEEFAPKAEEKGPWSDFGPSESPEKSNPLRRLVADPAISLLKGAVAVPEAAVGLADIVTGGRAGKLAEDVGFRPKETKTILDDLYSPEQKRANESVQNADGFVGTLGAVVNNPSVIPHAVLESAPSMIAGGAISKALPVGGAIIRGAVGEGLVGAGSAAEQMRQGSEDGLMTPKQEALAAASGAGTAMFGAVGGKVANKLGIGDVETMLAGGAKQVGKKGVARSAAEGAVSEGLLEETPQSAWEQATQNIAMDRPIGEGLGSAAAMGLVTGGAMGAGGGAVGSIYARARTDQATQPKDEIAGLLPAPTSTGTPSDQVLQSDVARQNAVDAAQSNAERIYAERAAYEEALQGLYPFGMPTLTTDPAPLQQRIDEMLGIDPKSLKGLRKIQYQKQFEAAMNEVVGITHDENGLEMPLTMGALLDSQVMAEDAAMRRIANENANTRSEQLADEENSQIDPIPVVGPLSAIANQAIKTGVAAQVQAQKVAAENPNGELTQNEPDAAVAAPSAPAQGSDVPGGGSILEPAPTGNTNAVVDGAEVAKPSMRPAVATGGTGKDSLTTQSQGISDVQKAAQAKQSEPATPTGSTNLQPAAPVRGYPQGQARMLAGRLTRQGLPSEIYPHPTQAGMFAIGVAGETQAESTPAGAPNTTQGETNGQETASPAPALTVPVARQRTVPPNQRRDDLVGAILRVTGGDGIASNMADTIVGEKANNVGKLRGLFTNRGQQDLDDLATKLRDEEGYDVQDGSQLEALVRSAASGDVARSMARQEADAEAAKGKQYRDEIRAKAKKFGIKTVAVKFSELEKIVLKRLEERHNQAISQLDERSQQRFNAALEEAMTLVPEEVVDETLADVNRRGLHAREFWNEATRILRGMIYDAKQEAVNGTATATEETGDGRGNSGTGRGTPADQRDQAPASAATRTEPSEEQRPGLDLQGQTPAEVRAQEAQRQAEEARANRPEPDSAPRVKADQVDLFNTQGGLFDGKQTSSAASTVDEDVLKDVRLLQESRGQWQYKFNINSNWFTANSKEDAVERATATYHKTPANERLTRQQRFDKANADEFADMDSRYGKLSLADLRSKYAELGGDIESLQRAGVNEINGNGGRRTGAAVSAQGARETAEERMRLGRYIKSREDNAPKTLPERIAAAKQKKADENAERAAKFAELRAKRKAEKEGKAGSDRITQDTEITQRNQIVRDGKGNEYQVHSMRNKLLIAHPMVNGKAEVNRDSAVRFWLDPKTIPSGESDRTDPIYLVDTATESKPAEDGKPADVNYADDFAIRPVEITEHLISTGNIKALYKAAGVKTADAFGDLPMDQRSKAYAQYVADGGKPAPAATEAYNDKAARQEREALVRRLQSDATVRQASGKPFKTEASAKEFSTRHELDDTHEAVKVETGYVLKRLPEARRPSVLKAMAERQANDPENQRQERAFARSEKIGAAASDAVTAYENGDTSIEQFEAALDAAEKAKDGDPAVKEPWKMTRNEWAAEREAVKPNVAQSKFTKASASEAVSNDKRLQYLLYGVSDDASSKLKAAAKGEIKLSQNEVDSLLERVNTPVSHEDVVAKALSEGKPVPNSVLEEYPNLQPSKAEVNATDAVKKIEDFGEKIGGARKDVWTSFKDSIKDVPDNEIANYPLSKSWPEPNYQALINDGADPWSVAFMHAARDEVPRKPSAPYKVKRWADQVQALREMTSDLVGGKHNKEFVQSEMRSGQLSKLASRIELYELVGHEKSLAGISFAKHHYSLYKGRENVNLWVVEKDSKTTAMSNWPSEIATADTKEELLDRFKAAYASLDSENQKSKAVSFDLYAQGGKFFVGKKMGRNITQLAGPFDSVKEARAYRNDNHDELITRLEKAKEIPKARRDSNEPRVGEDMRDGQDVTPQLFAETFGFKGVEFGNWVEQKKRQKDLNDAFDALMDMAAIMEIPPKALSLNGELGLAFGARGTGGIDAAAAHYERDYVAINLTKKEGAGSIGHEWWHALDNYFSRMRGKSSGSMTEALDVSLSGKGSNYVLQGSVRKEMVDAFGRVMGAIRSTAMRARSMKLDNKRSKEYWTTSPEMSARAFESYLISKLQDQNASNDYLANIVDAQTWKAAEALGFELEDSYPYPTAGEMPVIREAFESFFDTIQTKETDKGTALFNRANDGRITPSDKAVYGMAAEGKSATEILKFIASSSRNPFYRQLAKLLQQTGINPTITVGDSKGWKFNAGDGKYAAAYNPDTDTAVLFRPAASERNFLHELMHAATLKALAKNGLASAQMRALFNHVKSTGRAQGLFYDQKTGRGYYGMQDVTEFVAEAFTNPKFQQALKKVKAPSGTTGLQSAWHWFVRVVRGILGLKQGDESALSAALELGLGVMRENMGLQSNVSDIKYSYGLPAKQPINLPIDGARLKTLRRLAAGIERPKDGIFLRVTDNGDAIATGQKGQRIPDSFRRFAEDNGLTFKAERRLPNYTGGRAASTMNTGITPKSEPMPIAYRESGAMYFGEATDGALDRTDKTRFNVGAADKSKVRQIDTPEFRKWFGASKVVDADGKPLVVYHGTPKVGFSEFGTGNVGAFFSDRFDIAASYAGRYNEVEYDDEGVFADDGQGVYDAYLSLKNPKVLDWGGKDWGVGPEGLKLDDHAAKAKREGFDGLIVENVVDTGYLSPGLVEDNGLGIVYVAFEPTQIKSAVGNNGNFDPSNPDIRYNVADEGWSISEPSKMDDVKIVGDSGRKYDQRQREFFKNVGREIIPQSVVDRARDYLKNDFWKKMAVGVVDQFRGLRDLGDNGQAYMLARLSKGTAGAFETLLHHGKLSIKDGVYDGDQSGGFIEKLGVPLQGELDDFLWYVAANRAEWLSASDRENLFTQADIAAGKSLAGGTTSFDYTIQTGPAKGKVTQSRSAIYADALRVFNEFQKNTLDLAEQSGLIDGASRKHWESEFYVPFYRVSEEDGEFIGAKMGNALVRQTAFKKLKGGTDKLNSDLLSNTLLNWSHLIEASAKNRAARAALSAAGDVGAAQRVAPDMASYSASNGAMLPPGTKNTVWFQENGKKVEYLVSDPFVMTAITSLEYAGMRNGVMDVMTKFKHWLTIGVTASPAFKVRNLIRDSVQAIGTSGLSYNPIKNISEGYAQTKRDSQAYVSALASGGLIRFGTMLEGSESSRVRQLIKSGVKDSTILDNEPKWRQFYNKYLEPGISAYNELGNRSEEINRAALYNQLIKQGKSHAEAALLARDLMDFSMQGSFNTIRFLTQVVPFMNARLQGLYKLGRSAKDNPRKMAVVTGAVALASIALMLGYDDDDDWKRREDWDRDNFWWFKFGGVEFRIPKPFEIGAVATLAERSVEFMINDEMTGERFRKATKDLVMNNLSMNPVPQALKPIVDLYANKDSFTGRPIETMSMQRLDPTMRYSSSTSLVARGLSTATGGAASPVQYDHLVRAYFGWLGSFVIGGADMAARPFANEPQKPEADYWKLATQGIAKEQGGGNSRYLTLVYDQASELEQAYATHRQMIKEGKIEEAQDYAEDNADKLNRYRVVESVKRAESKFNENIRAVERSDLDPAEKKLRIERIQKMKETIAKRIAPGVQGP